MSRDIILRALPWDAYHDAEWHALYCQAARDLDVEFPDLPIAPVDLGAVLRNPAVMPLAMGAIRGIAPPVISLGDWHR